MAQTVWVVMSGDYDRQMLGGVGATRDAAVRIVDDLHGDLYESGRHAPDMEWFTDDSAICREARCSMTVRPVPAAE